MVYDRRGPRLLVRAQQAVWTRNCDHDVTVSLAQGAYRLTAPLRFKRQWPPDAKKSSMQVAFGPNCPQNHCYALVAMMQAIGKTPQLALLCWSAS